LQLKEIANFIRNLPSDTRVMVGYLRGPTFQPTQRFTNDLQKASKALRSVAGTSFVSENGPYDGLYEAIKRFDGLPAGRRAVLLIADGFDSSIGPSPADVARSPELDRAIGRAQRNGVAVYTIFSPTALTESAGSSRALAAQAGLQRLADETGGKSYFQGTSAPISLEPFFRDINMTLGRQFALTYLSTHMKKGYHRVEVTSTNPEVRIEHPKGYYYR
jgi:VWFA-related protein